MNLFAIHALTHSLIYKLDHSESQSFAIKLVKLPYSVHQSFIAVPFLFNLNNNWTIKLFIESITMNNIFYLSLAHIISSSMSVNFYPCLHSSILMLGLKKSFI